VTPTSADPAPDVLVDTSVAVALTVADHDHHHSVTRALGARTLGLSGHAAVESYSVLTRLPAPLRRAPGTARRLLSANFPATRFLPEQRAEHLLTELSELEIAGGAVYEALVGATAVAHQLPLATRDRKALETYRALGVAVEVID
jgi:predicted nucleic acid-binding protein